MPITLRIALCKFKSKLLGGQLPEEKSLNLQLLYFYITFSHQISSVLDSHLSYICRSVSGDTVKRGNAILET